MIRALFLLLVCLVPIKPKKALTFSEFIESTPKKYGILTYSRSKIGDYKKIKSHIDKYTSMQCSQMSQISIVEIGLQTYDLNNLTKDSSFKRPLYFIIRPYNSLDYRFYIPKQSEASVYFLINIGSQVTCNQLGESFDQWKMKALGDLGPIISIQGESFSFNTRKSEFQQVKGRFDKRYFHLNLLNGAWVSRFYLELYYFQACRQISQIRQIVIKQNECEDIALNFIVYSFFSEFLQQLIKLNISSIKNQDKPEKNSEQIRSRCFKNFVNIIGFNPMRIIDKKSSIEQPFNYESKKYIVYAKRRQLQMRMKNQYSQIFKNENEQKTLIQKIFIDQNLSALVEEKKNKLQQLRKSRDNLIKIRLEENQEYSKYQKIIIVLALIYLVAKIFIKSRLIRKYKNSFGYKQQNYKSVTQTNLNLSND